MNTNSRNMTYSTIGDYQLPNLTLNQPRKPLGKYGRLRRTYLKEQRPVLYHTMLMNGSLYPHLMEVEQTAESRMQQTMEQLLKQNPAPNKAGAASDGVGATHEQPESTGRGTGAERADLQLSFFDAHIPTEAQQIEKIDQRRAKNRPPLFVLSQAEIENALRRGSNVEGSKLRIWKIYQLQPDRKLRAKALANEYAPYGPGGSSHTYLDGSSGWLDHDSKGLTFEHYPDHQKVLLRWDRVEKYIDLMIQSDRYLSDKERRSIDFPLELNAASAAEYTALKAQHPDTLVGFEASGNFMFYGEDAAKVAKVLNSALFTRETALGEVQVTGFPPSLWARKSKELWSAGNDVYLAGLNEDGTHHQTKHLHKEDYLPIGSIINMDGRKFRIDGVDFDKGKVSLQDMALADLRMPIFREEPLSVVRELYEQEQDVMEHPLPDYKAGDNVIVDLPTRTIEGKIGYVGETDVRIDTSAHGQSWDNEVLNKQQFEDGLRQVTPELTDEELDALPISAVMDGKVQTFPDAAALDKALNAEPAPEPAGNFHITDDDLGIGGPKQKYARNIEAIRTLFQLEQEHRGATAEEQQVLSQYVGWGGLADAFDPNKENWSAEYTQLKELLSEDEYAAARSSTLNAHYTSPTVIRGIYDAVERMGFRSGNILEPSMGVGNFFGMLPDTMQGSRLYGVELDSITGRIAKKLYPQADITVAGFETTDRRDFYDLAVGNVPFGQYKVKSTTRRTTSWDFLSTTTFSPKPSTKCVRAAWWRLLPVVGRLIAIKQYFVDTRRTLVRSRGCIERPYAAACGKWAAHPVADPDVKDFSYTVVGVYRENP